MYAEGSQSKVTVLMHSFYVGVLWRFTCAESLANSGTKEGVWVHALRFV